MRALCSSGMLIPEEDRARRGWPRPNRDTSGGGEYTSKTPSSPIVGCLLPCESNSVDGALPAFRVVLHNSGNSALERGVASGRVRRLALRSQRLRECIAVAGRSRDQQMRGWHWVTIPRTQRAENRQRSQRFRAEKSADMTREWAVKL